LVSGFETLSMCILPGVVMLGLTTLVGVGVLGLVLVVVTMSICTLVGLVLSVPNMSHILGVVTLSLVWVGVRGLAVSYHVHHAGWDGGAWAGPWAAHTHTGRGGGAGSGLVVSHTVLVHHAGCGGLALGVVMLSLCIQVGMVGLALPVPSILAGLVVLWLVWWVVILSTHVGVRVLGIVLGVGMDKLPMCRQVGAEVLAVPIISTMTLAGVGVVGTVMGVQSWGRHHTGRGGGHTVHQHSYLLTYHSGRGGGAGYVLGGGYDW